MTNLEYSNAICRFAYNSPGQNSGMGSPGAPAEGLGRWHTVTPSVRSPGKHFLVIWVVGRMHTLEAAEPSGGC